MNAEKLRSLFDMTGRVVIVTGATRGIGRALAEGYAAAGAKVVVTSRKAAACEETVKHLRGQGGDVIGVPCYVDDLVALRDLVGRTVEEFGAIDVVVNNAANALAQILAELPDDMIVFSSDFPHFEGLSDPMDHYAKVLDGVPEARLDRFFGGSIADVYARMGDPIL